MKCGREMLWQLVSTQPPGGLVSDNGASVLFPNSANEDDQYNPTIHFHSGTENDASTLGLLSWTADSGSLWQRCVLKTFKAPAERSLCRGPTAFHQQPAPRGSLLSKSLAGYPQASTESSYDKTPTSTWQQPHENPQAEWYTSCLTKAKESESILLYKSGGYAQFLISK